MNKQLFYDQIRHSIFKGKIKPSQFEGIETILDYWIESKLTDSRWLAYMLATVYHETAGTMQPIKEYGFGKGRPYGKPDPETGHIYAGRGFVQLTWKFNYIKAGKELGIDLVNNPDLALDMNVATKILFKGMINGWFTGKRLSQYFNSKVTDWRGARKIINGLDKADLIAEYAKKFKRAILF